MATMLVESLTAEFEPSKYRDEYREQVLDLIARKAAGEQFELPAATGEAPAVVDLLSALEASVAAAKESRKRHPTARPATAKKAAAKRPTARRKTA
jgi:DNA end-binding protein Ku